MSMVIRCAPWREMTRAVAQIDEEGGRQEEQDSPKLDVQSDEDCVWR
jgi:hypothetical protein